jgi:small-conductance mechanosensitive channel
MSLDLLSGITAGIAATIVWFIIGAVVYMNPFVAKIYKKYENDPSVKNRKDVKTFIINTFVFSVLIQCFLFAFVYLYIKDVLPGTLILNTFYFGLILIVVKIIPRLFDMYVQSKYPNTLLIIELINGAIGSFVIAFVFAFII